MLDTTTQEATFTHAPKKRLSQAERAFIQLLSKTYAGDYPGQEEIAQVGDLPHKLAKKSREICEKLRAARQGEGIEGFWKVYKVYELDNILSPDWRATVEIAPAPEEEIKERPYQLRPLSYFKNRPKKEWAVHEIVFDRGTSLFAGPGGSGKSAFVLDMYLSRVCNQPFLGRAVKPAFLIWVAAESLDELYPRAQGWLKSHGISEDEPLNMLILDQRMPLNDVEETGKFIVSVKEQLAEINVSSETHSIVIVFDTYSKCTPGADENNTKEVKIIVELIDLVCNEISVHATIICHTNADGIIKGNKALRDGVDTVWMVSKNNDTICLTPDKMRGAPEAEHPIYACMRSIVLDENDPTETAPVVFALDEKVGSIQFTPNAQKKMLAILASAGSMSVNDWQRACEKQHSIKKSTFFAHKKRLIAEKLITPPPSGASKGAQIDHEVTELGRQLLESSPN